MCPLNLEISKFNSGRTRTKVPVRTGCNQLWTHGSCNKVVAMARHTFAQINLYVSVALYVSDLSGSGGSAQSNSCLDKVLFGFLQCVFTWGCPTTCKLLQVKNATWKLWVHSLLCYTSGCNSKQLLSPAKTFMVYDQDT